MTAPLRRPHALTTIHAFLPSTLVATADGPVRAARLAPGARLRTAQGWVDLLDIGRVSPSAAACAARPALRAFTIDPDALGPNLPPTPMQVAAGTPVVIDLRDGGVVAVRGIDLARAGIGRIGPPTRPVALRRLHLSAPEAIVAAGLRVVAAPGGPIRVLPPAAAADLGAEALRRGLRRANAAAVLRGLCARSTPADAA